ncbi:MAG: type I-C CRISPR-associated protein Cas7/Csd2 [Rickettsiales bacterium]|nr:type I-C CRISPR-associated protein Cas7/Csd2 [Rickettsiales bacterium]
MSTLNKIDFAVIFKVENANPNGDPLNENIPRYDSDYIGEVTDVCIKRKIRNRLLDTGKDIFVQSDDYKNDEYSSLKERLEKTIGKKDKNTKEKDYVAAICKKFFDVRAFGQVIAWDSQSIGIRGPVTIQSAYSISPIEVVSKQITKSVSNEKEDKKGSDTMGMKHSVKPAIYVFKGSINTQLAKKTGFSSEDAMAIKEILPKLFENDESSARPAGSMQVLNVIWWQHNSELGQYSSAKVHRSLCKQIGSNGNILNEKELMEGTVEEIKGLKADIQNGW